MMRGRWENRRALGRLSTPTKRAIAALEATKHAKATGPSAALRQSWELASAAVHNEYEAAARTSDAAAALQEADGAYRSAADAVVVLFAALGCEFGNQLPQIGTDTLSAQQVHRCLVDSFGLLPDAQVGLSVLDAFAQLTERRQRELEGARRLQQDAGERSYAAILDLGAALDRAQRFVRQYAPPRSDARRCIWPGPKSKTLELEIVVAVEEPVGPTGSAAEAQSGCSVPPKEASTPAAANDSTPATSAARTA